MRLIVREELPQAHHPKDQDRRTWTEEPQFDRGGENGISCSNVKSGYPEAARRSGKVACRSRPSGRVVWSAVGDIERDSQAPRLQIRFGELPTLTEPTRTIETGNTSV